MFVSDTANRARHSLPLTVRVMVNTSACCRSLATYTMSYTRFNSSPSSEQVIHLLQLVQQSSFSAEGIQQQNGPSCGNESTVCLPQGSAVFLSHAADHGICIWRLCLCLADSVDFVHCTRRCSCLSRMSLFIQGAFRD